MKKLAQIFVGMVAGVCLSLMLSAVAMPPNYGSAVLVGTDAGGGVTNPVSASSPVPVNTENGRASYRATIADLSPAASATDVTTVCGSLTKTVKVQYVQASADSTAPASLDFYIFMRAASDVGGTSSVVAVAQLDQNSPAPTATVLKYTANPSSLGTGVMMLGDHYAMPAAASTGYPITQWMEIFGTRNTQPIVLRGTNQCVAFGFNGQTIPSGTSVYVNWEFTEE